MFARLHMTVAAHIDCYACMHFVLENGLESLENLSATGQKYEACYGTEV